MAQNDNREFFVTGTNTKLNYTVIPSLRPNGTAIENVIMRDPSQSHLVEHHLGGIFRCSWPILQKLNKSGFPTVRKFEFLYHSIPCFETRNAH